MDLLATPASESKIAVFSLEIIIGDTISFICMDTQELHRRLGAHRLIRY